MGGCRLATPEDFPAFRTLWHAYMKDTHENHGGLEPCTQNLWFFTDLFNAYTRGSLFGVCVLWEDDEGVPRGIFLAGEDTAPSPFKLNVGKVVHVWGVYMSPECRKQHAALEMQLFAEPRLLSLGFVVGRINTRLGNTAGESLARAMGSEARETVWQYTLRDRSEGES